MKTNTICVLEQEGHYFGSVMKLKDLKCMTRQPCNELGEELVRLLKTDS